MDGPTGGDLPWAATASATEFGTVWEPAASLWRLPMARSSAIRCFPSIISALVTHNYHKVSTVNEVQKDKQKKTMRGKVKTK